jgi:hypothetical protein
LYAGKESAVSEVIGSVMLISIVVLAVAIVGVVLWSQPPPEKIPSLSAGIANESCKVSVSHNGGDMLENATFRILVDGTDKTTNFAKNGNPVWTSWGIGETLTYTSTPCPPMPQNVQIIYTGGNGALSLSSAYFGTQPSGTGAATPTTTVTTTPTPGPAPTVTSITPNTGVNTTTISITNLAGTNFLAGATVKLNRTGYADIAGTSVNVVLPTQITCTFDLTNKAAGQWNVVVTNTDGQSGILINGFAITRPSPNPPWYNCNWGNRKNITIDKSRVSGTLSDFPVLINLPSDAGLASYAQSNGNDILFTSSDGTTKINYERESYSSGTLVAWVQVPTLSHTADTVIYMYYGNSGASDQQAATLTWDANFKGVWHLKEATGANDADSTSNGNTGTPVHNPVQTVGKIDGSLQFDGTNDAVTVSPTQFIPLSTGSYSLEVWVWDDTPYSGLSTFHRMISWSNGATTNNLQFGLGTGNANPNRMFYLTYGSANALAMTSGTINTGWNYGVITYSGSTYLMYVNGALRSQDSYTRNDIALFAAPNLYIGQRGNGAGVVGTLDEVRISNIVRSADWIATDYNNQNSPSTFYYLGNQEQWTC